MTKARKSLLARTSSVGASKALQQLRAGSETSFKTVQVSIPGAGGLCTTREVDTRFPGFMLTGLLWTDPEKRSVEGICGLQASLALEACQHCHPSADGNNCNVAVELS